VGEHPSLPGGKVVATAGRFGPYVQWGAVSAALPRGLQAQDVTLEAAVELLLKKREKLVAKGQALEALAPKQAKGSAAGSKKGRRSTPGKGVQGGGSGGGQPAQPKAELVATDERAAGVQDQQVHQKQGRITAQRQGAAGNADKKTRAPSAYLLFCMQRREELKAAGVKASPKDVMRMLASEWRARNSADIMSVQE
jgi:hypothetical protein